MLEMIIHEIDSEKIALGSGFDWAYDLTVPAADPVDDPNLGYVSHPYLQKGKPPWESRERLIGDSWPIGTRSS